MEQQHNFNMAVCGDTAYKFILISSMDFSYNNDIEL